MQEFSLDDGLYGMSWNSDFWSIEDQATIVIGFYWLSFLTLQLHWFKLKSDNSLISHPRYVIRSFFSEIDLFPGSGSIASFKYTPGTGHYSQMMWSRVKRVGCGFITHYNGETAPLIARYYVCDYGPSGNKVKREIFGD